MSRLLRDEITPGIDAAVYWIEYVLRNGDTKHLQTTAKNLSFYQLYLFDVAAFLLLVLVAILSIEFVILRALFRCLLARKSDVKQKTS